MKNTLRLSSACIIPIVSFCIFVSSQECKKVDKGSGQETIAFLRGARNSPAASDACVISALRKLKYERSTEAIEVVLSYLDFNQYKGSGTVVTGSNGEAYPAVQTLFAIGKPALPFLIQVAGGSTFSKVAQQNAVRTVMMIFRDDPPAGLRYLRSEADRSQEPGRRALLQNATRFGLRWCQGEQTKECEALISTE